MTLTDLLLVPPQSTIETLYVVVGGLGAILLLYGIFLERERHQDAVFLVAGLALFTYAASLPNLILMIAFGAFALGSLMEIIQILRGKHKHPGA